MKTKHHSILTESLGRSGDPTRNNRIRRRWFALALGGFFFASIFALSAPMVEAQCKQWNVGFKWRFTQGSRVSEGTKITTGVDMNLQQNGTVVTGTARL